MKPRTALVTGGTSGVGLSIVRALADQGVDVHFIGTNADKGHRVERELHDAGHSGGRFVKLDLSHLREVDEFARAFRARVPKLDVLVNVAGVMLFERQETADGLEKTFAIDYLSAFILCRELTPVLAEAEHPRIVNVGGAPKQIFNAQLDFDDLGFNKSYDGVRAAIHAVHAKVVLTEILAERLRSEGIDVNAFHPGWVKSDLGRNMPFPMSLLFRLMSVFFTETSRAGIYTTTSDEVTGVTGQFFVKEKPTPLRFELAYKDRLWRESEATVAQALS